jgi:hypothetical protein
VVGHANATWLEIVWSWLSLVGFFLALRLAYFIRRSRHRMYHRSITGVRVDVNRTRQRGQNGQALIFLGFFLVGAVATLTPPPVAEANQLASSFSAVVFICVLLRMLYDTIRDSLDRERQIGSIIGQAFAIEE